MAFSEVAQADDILYKMHCAIILKNDYNWTLQRVSQRVVEYVCLDLIVFYTELDMAPFISDQIDLMF